MTRSSDSPTLSAFELVDAIARDPSLRDDPLVRARHDRVIEKASVCSYCGVGCPYTVEENRRGKEEIVPLSELGLCVKGQTSLFTGSDDERTARLASRGLPDDRIRAPMIRDHDGTMKVVSWEEALDRAAWLFLHSREWVGPEAVAIYGNGQKTLESIWMASLYKLVFRMPTLGANSEHCLASAGAAHELNFGNEASFTSKQFDELAHCDVAVLHGTNAFVTFPQAYEKLARNTRALKVVIDPVRTDTVSELQAIDPRTLHIQFRQGGDVLFNLAVSRVILDEGWEDQAFLGRAVDPGSVAELRALCAEERCVPEVAAARIALPGQDPVALAAMIRRYAALLARVGEDGARPKVAFVSSMGINQSTGSYGFSTNLNLLLLTGNVGRPGAGSLRIAGQSNATSELLLGFNGRRLLFNLDPQNSAHRATLAQVLDLPEENFPRELGTPVARMADDDHIYCFLFIGTQMTRNMPRLGHWQRRLGRAFNVVIDPFLGEGVLEHADVILPALTYTERTGIIQRGDRTLQLQQPISAPPPLAWSDEQILVQLALAIARRLRDPDTAAINELDPEVVERAFARYLGEDGQVDASIVFDHMVEVSRQLDLYSRLEDGAGQPISHAMLRQSAGRGVQWGGDGRYAGAASEGAVFPGLQREQKAQARLVRPPDAFLAQLDAPLPEGTLSLISGRGRPGHRARFDRGRYNSGIKTLPISGRPSDDYFVELSPVELRALGLSPHQPVRLVSAHGVVVARVAENARVPEGVATIDFVPGEVNRLTDYVDADRFTNQSFIKRTPVQIRALRPLEAALWDEPRGAALDEVIAVLFASYRETFPTDDDWLTTQRDQDDAPRWLPPALLRQPRDEAELRVSEAAGALTAFFQRYAGDVGYRAAAARVLRSLSEEQRDRLLRLFLPFVRRLDYQSIMHPVLADLVGSVRLVDEAGKERVIDLLSAHKSAVLELKEEIVAIQLYVAIKRAIERLFGPGEVVRQRDLAFVSGVAIPCAGDVPAHFLGISPAELGSATLVHSRAIGGSALIVVDRRSNRAVRIDIETGVLPKDRELTLLRGTVINRKRAATASQHRRFFDRLGELIVEYVRTGDDNFAIFGPVALPWAEYQDKLAFAPPSRTGFVDYLIAQRASTPLVGALAELGVLEPDDVALVHGALAGREGEGASRSLAFSPEQLYAGTLQERVNRVVDTIITPVLKNDGGRIDILEIRDDGDIEVRFVGSCANCPYSLLSMEQIVKPTMLQIPGVKRVTHRARLRDTELANLHTAAGKRALKVLASPEAEGMAQARTCGPGPAQAVQSSLFNASFPSASFPDPERMHGGMMNEE